MNSPIAKYIAAAVLALCLWLGEAELRAEEGDYYRAYLISYPETVVAAVKEPFQWQTDDWLKAGGILAAGGALYLFDEKINEIVQRNKSPLTGVLAEAGNTLGNGYYLIPTIAVSSLAGYVLDDKKLEDTAWLSLKSVLLAGAATSALKLATQRQRPQSGNGKEFWNGSGFSWHRDSFPSGHTTNVWAVATIVAEQYKSTKWVPSAAYGLALLTPYARMHDRKHWSSDVFAGALIGYLSARLTLKTTPRLEVLPNPELGGVWINYSF